MSAPHDQHAAAVLERLRASAPAGNPLCLARNERGPLTSKGRVIVGTPNELIAHLGWGALADCTIDGDVDGAVDTVYVTEWAAGR